MSYVKKDDILYLLIIPINLFYYYSHKYLYGKSKNINKQINGF
jgi:hypothetical protein